MALNALYHIVAHRGTRQDTKEWAHHTSKLLENQMSEIAKAKAQAIASQTTLDATVAQILQEAVD